MRARERYDFFTHYFTLVMTLLTFLSAVYVPIEQMRVWPLTAVVELVRPWIMGQVPEHVVQRVPVLMAYAAVGCYLALILMRRRFF